MGKGAGYGTYVSLHPHKWQAHPPAPPHPESSKQQLSDGISVYLLHTPHANTTKLIITVPWGRLLAAETFGAGFKSQLVDLPAVSLWAVLFHS